MQTIMELIMWGVSTLVGAFAGSFLGAYMKKKGENLATHEDIEKLLDQVRAVTTTTKEIEAKISGQMWDRQKRWEVRRDILFEAAKGLGKIKDALSELVAAYRTDFEANLQGNYERTQRRIKYNQELLDAAASFDNTSLLVGLICGDDAHTSVMQFSLFTRELARKAMEWDSDTLNNGLGRLGTRLAHITDDLRKELARVES